MTESAAEVPARSVPTDAPLRSPALPDGAPVAGLSPGEVERRRALDGPNRPPPRAGRSVLGPAREVLSEPMILLLVGAAVVYAVFGELRDAVLLAGSVAVVIALDLTQERRAERALEALESLSAPTARVVREGRITTVPAAEIVRGDWVFLSEGDRVPADGLLRTGAALSVDESMLTGESVPVSKSVVAGFPPGEPPGGDGRPFVYAQTMVVRGSGWAEVTATGPRAEVSRIARALTSVETRTPVLRAQTRGLVRGMAALAVALTVVVAVAIGWRTSDWTAGLLAGMALAIGLLPEEIPVVLTIYSVLGARRMALRRALARRFGTLPTLGSVTVLVTDKTGTLTQNRMRVTAAAPAPGRIVRRGPEDPPGGGEAAELLALAALANDPTPVDPTELAVAEAGAAARRERFPATLRLVEHVPFSRATLRVTNEWEDPATGRRLRVAKGAAEAILRPAGPTSGGPSAWASTVEAMASEGLRVLAVAVAEGDGAGSRPEGSAPRVVGLLGLEDPIRPGVPAAIEECRTAGIRVVMMTGDHPVTARAIARAAGMSRPDRVVVGPELPADAPAMIDAALASGDVFARATPELKLGVVRALQARGEVVAMTGDGVNDAPALRAADVGIAMGQRGTDVAREASSIVLLDDAFPTVVEAIRLGRGTYANIRKAIVYLIGFHLALGGVALIPVLFGLPVVLFPVEIVFLELIVDPASSLVFEQEPIEPGTMAQPPRDPREPLVGAGPLLLGVLLGAGALVAASGTYLGAIALGVPTDEGRALSFAALLSANLGLVLVNRSLTAGLARTLRVRNPVAVGVLLLGAALLVSAVYLPAFRSAFGFDAPPPLALAAAALLGFGGVLGMDPLKAPLLRAMARRGSPTGPREPPSGPPPGGDDRGTRRPSYGTRERRPNAGPWSGPSPERVEVVAPWT